jgi:glutamine synthetase
LPFKFNLYRYSEDLEDYSWINDKAKPDKIAKAMMCWALDRKATSFCHWFQPMASTFRHGDTGQVQMSMLEFNDDGTPTFELKVGLYKLNEPLNRNMMISWFQSLLSNSTLYRYVKGKHILFGETDGSSYPNGGMRATHTAAGLCALTPLTHS